MESSGDVALLRKKKSMDAMNANLKEALALQQQIIDLERQIAKLAKDIATVRQESKLPEEIEKVIQERDELKSERNALIHCRDADRATIEGFKKRAEKAIELIESGMSQIQKAKSVL